MICCHNCPTSRVFQVSAKVKASCERVQRSLTIVSPSTRTRTSHPSGQASNEQRAACYDLLSAPVVDDRGKLIGRVTADLVMDFIRTSSANEVLGLAGLREAEDLFAPVLDSARNRWPWLAVNLGTAFIASQVIGMFEGDRDYCTAIKSNNINVIGWMTLMMLHNVYSKDSRHHVEIL
jgi:hypothetical protein